VLRHNAWDVLSLVALAAHLAAVCDGPDYPLQAARAAEYTGDFATAAASYAVVLGAGPRRAVRLEALERSARCHLRMKQYDQAAAAWQALIAESRGRRLVPFVELAKILEHRRRDPAAALATVEEALALVRRGMVPPGAGTAETSLAALERRRARLTLRVSSASS
jgi:tetratricopeptide (TPR) repeat protein